MLIVYVSTDLVYATHPIKKQISDDPIDSLTINAKPLDSTTILVMGHVPRGVMEPVELMIMANSTIITRDRVDVDSNFKYWAKIKTNPELWNVNGTYGNGTYTITAYQGQGKLPFFVTTNINVVSGLLEIPEFRISTPLVLLVSVAVIVAVIVVLYQKGKFSKLYPKQ